ncbi:MAG: PAS/PAC sensor-containing diguanylate cyclase/phosphodiesterase, partial [Comamonadaceae bacterium]
QTRALAENAPPQAYQQAQALQSAIPAEATQVDQARAFNLLARIEAYLALIELSAQHAQLALDLATRHGDRTEQAKAYLTIVLTSIHQGKIAQSRDAATRSVALLHDIDRPDLLGEAMLRMAMTYRRYGDFERAVSMNIQAMEMAKLSNNPLALAYADQGLAMSYDHSGRLVDAHEGYVKMRSHAQAAGSKLLEGHAIQGMADITASLGDPVTSERLMREAIDIFRALHMPFRLNPALYGLANALRRQGHYTEALKLLDESIASYTQYTNPLGLWYALNARSINLQALNRLTEARSDAQRAQALAKEINFSLYLSESAKRLAAIAAAEGKHSQAYLLSTEAGELAEKARIDKASERIVELTQHYESESKQHQINDLTRRNEQQATRLHQRELQDRWIWTLVLGGFILMAGTLMFLFHLRRSNRKLAALNTQVLKTQNQLQATLNAIPDPLFVLDLDGRYHDCRYPSDELLTMPKDHLIGKTVSEVLPPAAAHICMSALRDAHEKGHSTGKQIELQLAQSQHWFELSVARKPTSSVHEPLFIMLSRDITERKRSDIQEEIRRRIFERLAHDSNLTEILGLVVRYIEQVYPDFTASIMLVDKQGKHLDIAAAPKLPMAYQQAINGIEIGEGFGTCGTAAWRGTMVIAEDLNSDPLWKPYRHLTQEAGFLSCWSEPIFDSHSQILGALGIYQRKTGRPSEEDIRLLRRASYLASIAIERKRMEYDLQETQVLLRQLAARSESAREDERKNLKRELHDELGQYLLALRMGVSVIDMQFGSTHPALQEKTQRLIEMVDTTIKVVRNVVTLLRPSALDMGIASALEWLVNEYFEQTSIQCELHVTEMDLTTNELRDTAIFRIVQESLTNVVRHAKATKVEITLEQTPTGHLLKVQDNGVGFDPSQCKEKSFGLFSIRERVLMLGGDYKLTSTPGQGTLIQVQIPVSNK